MSTDFDEEFVYSDFIGIAQALDNAFSWRLAPSGGLLAEMIFISRSTDRPAQAVGVTAATWNKWMTHARGLGGARPTAASREKIRAAIRQDIARHWRRINPSRAEVTSVVIWNGYTNATPNRTVNLDDLDLQATITAYAYGNSRAMTEAFLLAVKDRYGVPVEYDEVETIDIYR